MLGVNVPPGHWVEQGVNKLSVSVCIFSAFSRVYIFLNLLLACMCMKRAVLCKCMCCVGACTECVYTLSVMCVNVCVM